MKYPFISDCHIHSDNSFDGKDSVMMLAQRAHSLGLYAVTITDHCDCNDYFANDMRSDIEGSVRDACHARGHYADRLRIYTGIELGQPTQDKKAADEAMSLYDYDFVLGSLHNLRDEQDFYYLDYTPENTPGLLERYFDELVELIEDDRFDSLAHMTYPFRYIYGKSGLDIPVSDYREHIDRVLSLLVKREKALEINTSGLRQAMNMTMPDGSIVSRFRELGGRYVTIGSDAHRWGDVGAGIEDGLRMLLKCGFTHFTVYEERRPMELPIC